MARYIDVEQAIKHLRGKCVAKYPTTFFNGLFAAADEIDKLPTADVVEVRHGEWLDTGGYDAHYQPIYQCSYCFKEVADGYIVCHKYCLHCGAKMDGKDISVPTIDGRKEW